MGNYTPYQVYERIPFQGKAPDQVIFTGLFRPLTYDYAGIPIEIRITSPPEAVTSGGGLTGAGFPSFELAGGL